jgi:hypothetical protein
MNIFFRELKDPWPWGVIGATFALILLDEFGRSALYHHTVQLDWNLLVGAGAAVLFYLVHKYASRPDPQLTIIIGVVALLMFVLTVIFGGYFVPTCIVIAITAAWRCRDIQRSIKP